MEALINYLLQFGHLNQQQIDLVKSKGIFREIENDKYYQEAGKIPREIIFVTEGIFRICYYNNKGDDITKYFFDEHNCIVDINSLAGRKEGYCNHSGQPLSVSIFFKSPCKKQNPLSKWAYKI